LFADEPTGNLDSQTGQTVMDLLFNLNRQIGCTLILVTHDIDLARRCEIQISIQDGSIASINNQAQVARVQDVSI
jgi:putative ABC transport system ATP-binding protein